MRTPSRTVKKKLNEKFPEYKFSVRTTKPQSRHARKNNDAYLHVTVLLPIELDSSTKLSLAGTVKSFIRNSEEIKGWHYNLGVGCRKQK